MAHRPQLLVHLIFHPSSDAGRKLALDIHQALNADPNVPGLRIPTVFCAEDGSGAPPVDPALDRAARSFVMPLADTEMDVDPAWCGFVAELWQRCQGSAHRCVPFQLSEYAQPLDDRLRGVNFVRAFALKEAERSAFVVRRLVTELCRFLHGDPLQHDSPAAPTKVFVSHTKLDLGQEPKVVEALQEYLKQDQPIKVWYDSGDIPGGSRFAREIGAGIEDSSLLCVRTDHYASREWCRKEVLLAKEKSRPIVVINALTHNEVRSFPYLGNVPELRWRGEPAAAVDLLLKETLRHLHSGLTLAAWQQPGDQVFLYPPEHLTTADLKPGAAVLYPDPPLGKEETDTLASRGIALTTPLERLASERPLAGGRIALSLSESTDIRRHGLDFVHFEDAALELCRYLLLKGATLVYGGHLGSAGFTSALIELVAAHNRLEGVDPIARIENVVGWPLPFDKALQSRYKHAATLVRVARPSDIDETLAPELVANPSYFPGDRSAVLRYAWARGMTAMREAVTGSTRARIIIGGTFGPTEKAQPDGTRKPSWYASRIPGVLEEVMIALEARQPLFLIGAFGGVAGLVADILEGRDRPEMSWEYQRQAPVAEEMRQIYEDRGDRWWDYPEMRQLLLDKGIAGLNPGLSVDEHRELLHTTDTMRMVELVIRGLDKCP